MPERVLLNTLPVKPISRRQQVIHRVVDAVEMPPRIRTIFRITLLLPHKTDFLLCREDHAFK